MRRLTSGERNRISQTLRKIVKTEHSLFIFCFSPSGILCNLLLNPQSMRDDSPARKNVLNIKKVLGELTGGRASLSRPHCHNLWPNGTHHFDGELSTHLPKQTSRRSNPEARARCPLRPSIGSDGTSVSQQQQCNACVSRFAAGVRLGRSCGPS